jgi:CRISPR-associated protein Cas2
MGHCIVVYDISHDRTRTKVSEICLDYGLDRIQYSAFEGELVRTHQEELMLRLEEQLGKRSGNIQLYPICERDWAQRTVVDQRGEGGTSDEPDD